MVMKKNSQPTLKDIALEAGVSVMTASSVLNASRSGTRVSEATRTKIEEIAQRLGYIPNATARSLAKGRTQILGVVFGGVIFDATTLLESYVDTILQGISDGSGEHNYNVMIFPKPWYLAPRPAIQYRSQHIDGLIVIAPLTDSTLIPDLVQLGVHLVVISYPGESLGVTSVDVDSTLGLEMAMEHLLGLGHRKIAFLSGTPELQSAGERYLGYKTTLKKAGLSLNAEYVTPARPRGDSEAPAGSYGAETTYADTRRLLSLTDPPTAIIAGNDRMAFEALRAAKEAGVVVPEQLSIVGFDDRPEARFMTPSLTTVRQPLFDIGRKAAHLLIAEIEKPEIKIETKIDHKKETGNRKNMATLSHKITPELIVRGSTASVPP
jgi:DNA-binding LacI/PurR family transcriptional regulator